MSPRTRSLCYENVSQGVTCVRPIHKKSLHETGGYKMRSRGHFLMIKGSKYQEYITIINVYVPINRAPKYMKENQKKRERDKSIITVEDHQTLLSQTDRTLRQWREGKKCLNDTILADTHECHIPQMHNTFSGMHSTSTEIKYTLGNTTNLTKFQNTEHTVFCLQ